MSDALQVSRIKDGVILLKIGGDLSTERLDSFFVGEEEAERVIEEESKKRGTKIKIAVDLTDFTGMYDARAMERMARLAKKDAPYVEKTGCYGGPKLMTMLVELVASLAGRENIHFFETKEECEAWLEQ